MVKDFNVVSKKIAAQNVLTFSDELIGDAFQLDSVRSDGYGTEPGALPELLVSDLGNGEVEPRTQPSGSLAHDHPFVRQRLAMGKVDLQGTEYDRHRSPEVARVSDPGWAILESGKHRRAGSRGELVTPAYEIARFSSQTSTGSTLSFTKASITSPTLTSLKLASEIPHS